MIDYLFPYVSIFKHILQRNFWSNEKLIGDIKVPIMFIMSV